MNYMINRENGVNVMYRVISDHLGSVRLVINADTGVVAQRLRYDEWIFRTMRSQHSGVWEASIPGYGKPDL